jgi:uncharacterized protein YkwD
LALKNFAMVLAALLTMLPAAVRADVRDAVNWARLQGCRAAPARLPLRDNPKLAAAALRMAAGQSLHASLTSAGYLSTQASAVHLSGAVSEADVGRLLAGSYCATLTDPHLSEMGTQRRGREVWMVFAAPVSIPTMGDAALVSRQILGLVNDARTSGRRCGKKSFAPAVPLVLNSALAGAALAHSQDMARFGEFDHRGHDGSSPATRVERAGYGGYTVVGENIAAGAMTPIEVTQGWLASPAHCENIMDPRFSDIGIAFAVNLSSPELVYWTQDFALSRRSPPGRPR